jgi:hypothetical protein
VEAESYRLPATVKPLAAYTFSMQQTHRLAVIDCHLFQIFKESFMSHDDALKR